jgi:diguanylate cyclase (GGDEF)-like protein
LVYHFDLLKRFELDTCDIRAQLKATRTTHPSIAVIEISNDSISKIGRWPWSRDWHAILIKALSEAGAKAIVFDVLFSEPSDPEKDLLLSKAIKDSGKVYLAEVVEVSNNDKKSLLKSIDLFSMNAKGAGHINLTADLDGVMRRIPLVLDVDGQMIPQLALAVFLDTYGTSARQLSKENHNLLISYASGTFKIPLDKDGHFLIDWVSPWAESFKHYSFADVVASYAAQKKGDKPLASLTEFKDKICFVGTTASGLFDIRPTPLEPTYPAVGVNLMVFENLLNRRFVKNTSDPVNYLIFILLSFGLFFIMQLPPYFRSSLFTGLLAVGYAGISAVVFFVFGIFVPVSYALLLILLTYFFITTYNQLSVTIERSKLLKLATRDSLTGLYNIGHFKLLLQAEIATISIRREKSLSIIMGDVDNFKHTNDTYGHVTGDIVLKDVAQIMKNSCRALDVAARYGGEEFILMLPGANAERAIIIAETIRKVIHAKIFPAPTGSFQTSISIGVTQVSPDDTDITAVVARADRALYVAKKTGKNKVVLAEDSPKIDPSSTPKSA